MANRKAALGFIFVTVLLDIVGLGIIIPVIPDLIKELTGKGIEEATRYGGWLIFSFALMQFICAPVLGSLSDKYGRRPILLIALFGLSLDYIMHAISPTIFWLFVSRIFAGICGASITSATAYIADISTPEKRAQNFGLVGAAFGLGFIIGPAIGGVLSNWGIRAPFYFAAALAGLNFIYGLIILPESLAKDQRRAFNFKQANPFGAFFHLRKYPLVKGMFLSYFFLYLAGQSIHTVYTFFTSNQYEWGADRIGYSLAYVGVLVALVQGVLIRWVIPKFGQKATILVGLSMGLSGLVLISFASQGWMMFVFLIPYCLGGVAGPSIQGYISNQVPKNEQGELQGTITSLMNITTIIGSILMSNVYAFFIGPTTPVTYPGAPFMLGAVFIVVSIFLARKSLGRIKF